MPLSFQAGPKKHIVYYLWLSQRRGSAPDPPSGSSGLRESVFCLSVFLTADLKDSEDLLTKSLAMETRCLLSVCNSRGRNKSPKGTVCPLSAKYPHGILTGV